MWRGRAGLRKLAVTISEPLPHFSRRYEKDFPEIVEGLGFC